MHAPLHMTHKPSILAQAAAPVARVWQGVQNKVAKLVGLKNANTATGVVTAVGLTTLAVSSVLGPLGPAVYGAGLTITGLGAAGIAENYVTRKIAESDGKGRA